MINQYIKNIKILNKFYYIFFLLFFSFFINQYYGYLGILPLDSFLIFNSGYDVLNGYYPFKDYWTIKGVLLDLLQGLFFKFFGLSWFSYVLHASFFNCIITLATFYTLLKFNLNINLSFFYSICVAILAYPTAGTPFSDHHVTIISMLCLYSFILAIKTDQIIYWFVLPILMGLAFLSKQAPSSYFILIISFLSLIYFIFNFNFKKIIYGLLGVLTFLIIFFSLLNFGDIKFSSFWEQYILFPKSLGASRLDWVFPLEFKRVILRFKLIHLSILILFIVIFKNIIKKFKNIVEKESLIILSLIFSAYALILHQLMTINAIFIYFVIPIFAGLSHTHNINYFKRKNFITYFLIILTLSSTIYYFENYVSNRRFMDLNKVNLNKAIDGGKLNPIFKNIKWINLFYPEKPESEIIKLKKALEIIKNDNRKKMIVTDYQFISVLLSTYDFSPTRFWFHHHGYPSKENKYFLNWKNFYLNKLNENKIKIVYMIKPLAGETDPLKNILSDNCFKKEKLTDIIEVFIINKCSELNY